MPRIARIVIANWPHHITQRGNNHQDVVFTDDDRRTYLAVPRERCRHAGVRGLGYFAGTPRTKVSEFLGTPDRGTRPDATRASPGPAECAPPSRRVSS